MIKDAKLLSMFSVLVQSLLLADVLVDAHKLREGVKLENSITLSIGAALVAYRLVQCLYAHCII